MKVGKLTMILLATFALSSCGFFKGVSFMGRGGGSGGGGAETEDALPDDGSVVEAKPLHLRVWNKF